MPNPSRFGACAAVDAVTIVHDLRDVTSVTSHTQTHENRMTSGGGRVTACVCANELQRFLSGGSCFHDTEDLPLRLATGVFNLGMRTTRGGRRIGGREYTWAARLAHGSDLRTLLPSLGQAFPTLGIPERRILGGKASLEIRVLIPTIGWDVLITLHYSNGFQRRPLLSARPAPATAGLGRLQAHGNGEATAGPNGLVPNVPTVEESGRCQPPSSLRTLLRRP